MAEDRDDRLRGGKAHSRDRWFGLSDKPRFREFKRSWHSEKKFFGQDLMTREEAFERYAEWMRSRYPNEVE